MNLENDENLLLNEGKIGWHKTLGVTNKQLRFLKQGQNGTRDCWRTSRSLS